MKNYKKLSALLLSGSLLSTPVLALNSSATENAEAAEYAQDMEEIEVTGQRLSLDKMNAVKTPTPIIDVPQSLSIISGAQIARQNFMNIGDILRYTPGLSISQGEGHRDAIIIRGNQTTADFFLDGFRDDVQYYRPLYNLEQVEILRGSNALLFGRGGGGGVINRVTKQASFEDAFAGVTARVDSFGAYTGAADINAVVGETSAFRINAFYEEFANHRDFYGGSRFAINPTFRFMASDDTDITLSYEYLNDDRTVDRGVPSYNVEDGPDRPLKNNDTVFFGSPEENYTTLKASILRAKVVHTLNDSWKVNAGLQYADYDKVYQNLYASEEVFVTSSFIPEEVELDGYRDTTRRKNFLAQANIVGEIATGTLKHTLLFGAEYGVQDTANARYNNVFADNGDDQLYIPFTDPLVIPSFDFTDLARDRASDVTFASLYFQDQVDVTDWLKLIGGLRFDSFDIKVDDIYSAAEFNRKDEEVTPRFGAILKPQENISAYFSYSETFLPRSGDQFLTLSLDTESTRPQRYKNTEIGLKWDVRKDFSVTAAVYDLDRESYTSIDPTDPEQLIVISGSKTKGFELQAMGNIVDWWSITAGYSYQDGTVDGGNKTRQTPENMASVWHMFKVNDALSFGLGATYQDSYFVREDNSVEVPAFTRVDAAAYYSLSETTRLQLNVENMFDTDYFPDAHSNDNISTGKPLNVSLTLRTRF